MELEDIAPDNSEFYGTRAWRLFLGRIRTATLRFSDCLSDDYSGYFEISFEEVLFSSWIKRLVNVETLVIAISAEDCMVEYEASCPLTEPLPKLKHPSLSHFVVPEAFLTIQKNTFLHIRLEDCAIDCEQEIAGWDADLTFTPVNGYWYDLYNAIGQNLAILRSFEVVTSQNASKYVALFNNEDIFAGCDDVMTEEDCYIEDDLAYNRLMELLRRRGEDMETGCYLGMTLFPPSQQVTSGLARRFV